MATLDKRGRQFWINFCYGNRKIGPAILMRSACKSSTELHLV